MKGIRYDKDLYQTILNAYHRNKEYVEKRGKPGEWAKMRDLYDNEFWKDNRRSGKLSEVELAICFDVIETGLPIATARPPKPDMKPKLDPASPQYQQYVQARDAVQAMAQQGIPEEQLQQFAQQAEEMRKAYQDSALQYAENMQKQLIDDWENYEGQKTVQMGYRECSKLGNFVVRSEWDGTKIENEICDLQTIFPAPGVNRIKDHKKDVFIYAPIVTVEEIQRKYGVDELDESSVGDFKNGTFKPSATGWSASIAAAVQTARQKLQPNSTNPASGYALLIHAYMPDRTEIEYEDYQYDDKGIRKYREDGVPETKKEKRQKFTTGYKRVTIVKDHEGWILEESENGTREASPPFLEMVNFEQANDFFGVSDLKMIQDPMGRINQSVSNLHDNLRLTGNPIRLDVKGGKAKERSKTNEIGQVIDVTIPNAISYVQPPSVGYDVKWYISEFLQGWVDRISHLSEAIRGFNSYSQDSGKKVRELRNAAVGTFKPKLDLVANFSKEVFEHWAYLHQQYDEGIYLRKDEDEQGEYVWREFIPAQGKDIELRCTINNETLLPEDQFAKFDQALQLYQVGLQSQQPMVPPEYLIELAPLIDDKTRCKNYLKREREKMEQAAEMQQQEAMRAEAYQQFVDIAPILSDGYETVGNSQEVEQAFQQIVQIASQFPEIIGSQEFGALHPNVQKAILRNMVRE